VGQGHCRPFIRQAFIDDENGLTRTNGHTGLTAYAFIFIQVWEIGYILSNRNGFYPATGLAGVAGDMFGALDHGDRPSPPPDLGRDTGTVAQFPC
jgi:hypothetical protein